MSSLKPGLLDDILDFVVPYRRELRLLNDKLARQEERTSQLGGQVQQLQQIVHENVLRLNERVDLVALCPALIEQMGRALHHERTRLNYALATQEGVLQYFEDFHHARTTAEYQSAFTESNPLVSICIATTNRPDLLVERCLASLQKQTYQNLQIIVVGDHCIDSTPERLAAIKDERITFINLPERGPYPPPGYDRWTVAGTAAVNKALTMCEGQFVTHLDDDDRYEPDRIEIMVRAAQESRADICWHPFWFERSDHTWFVHGDGTFQNGQITTSSIFYHRYFARIPWDVFAYRVNEPGDWNRLRKIEALRPKKHFVNKPLAHHYFGSQTEAFVAQEGERFLD
jgi:hypothetical protein